MFPKFLRLLLVIVVGAVLGIILWQTRLLMVSHITFHSGWHYILRYVAVVAGFFLLLSAVQSVSIRSPVEVLGTPCLPETPYKFSNVSKRVADIILSITLLSILLPLLLLTSLLIFIAEGPPVFYISQRYISLDRCISVLKFRTMAKDALSPKYKLKERFMRNGYLDIPLSCEVYTPIGRFLERTQIVETLQLVNVLLHGMSIVGNRPLPRDNILLLRQFPGWERRFSSPAGLTGLSQIVGKMNQTPQVRLELEGQYSALYGKKDANIFLCDIYIVFYTVRLLLLKKTLELNEARRLIGRASGCRPTGVSRGQ